MTQKPQIVDGQVLYDALMHMIEPELTTAGMAELDAKYAAETAEERATRMKRYQKAFDAYRTHRSTSFSALDKQVRDYCKTTLTEAETESHEHDLAILHEVENTFFSAPSV